MEIQDKRLEIINIIVFIALLFVFSCKGEKKSVLSQLNENKNHLSVSTIHNLNNQFNQLKKSVVESKKEDAKVFFDFPIKNDDLWYKVLNDKDVEKYLGKSFTEKDFEVYFNKMFVNSFKDCLSDIDTSQLLKNGKFSSNFVIYRENDFFVKSQIEASYSNGELKLIFNSIIQNNTKEFISEHTEGYILKIINHRLKFASFYMAG